MKENSGSKIVGYLITMNSNSEDISASAITRAEWSTAMCLLDLDHVILYQGMDDKDIEIDFNMSRFIEDPFTVEVLNGLIPVISSPYHILEVVEENLELIVRGLLYQPRFQA